MADWAQIFEAAKGLLNNVAPSVVLILAGSLPGAFVAYHVMARQLKEDRKSTEEEEIRKLFYPLFDASVELYDRIGKIRDAYALDWLNSKYFEEAMQGEGFSNDPRNKGYFIFSSIFLFGKFFCWLEIVNKQAGYFYSPSKKRSVEVSKAVSSISRAFQFKEIWNKCESIDHVFQEHESRSSKVRDAFSLHRQFQHSIGELLTERHNEESRCRSFLEFFTSYTKDEEFRYWLRPLEDYVLDVSNYGGTSIFEGAIESGDIRALRLIAIQFWLAKLLHALAGEIKLKAPVNPEQVLYGLPTDVADTIRSIDGLQSDGFFSRGVEL